MRSIRKGAKAGKPGCREGVQIGMLEGKTAKEDRPHCESHAQEIGFDPGDTEGFKEAVVEENEPDCHV